MKAQLTKILKQIEKVGGDARNLIFEPPAQFDDVYDIEKKLGYPIPSEFKNSLCTLSAHLEFKWFLPNHFHLPDGLKEIFCGELHWGMDFILDFNHDKDGWIKEVFPDLENEYDRVWHQKFVFQEVGNGDYISIDLSTENYGKIIYLSHDDGEGHGRIMANSFTGLLSNWTQLGCVGGEDWQWLQFCSDEMSGIDPNCENAKLWKHVIGLA